MINLEQIQTALTPVVAEVKQSWDSVFGLTTIETPEQAQWAADVDGHFHERDKALAELDRQYFSAILDLRKRMFLAPRKQIKDIRASLKNKLAIWRQAEADRQRAAIAAAATHEEIQRTVAATAPPPQGMTERVTYVGKVVDESKLPRRFWTIDQAAIDREVRASKGQAQIPGVQIQKRTTMVRR